MERALFSASTADGIVKGARDLIQEHGEQGSVVVRKLANVRTDVLYDEENQVVAAFDHQKGSLKLIWITLPSEPGERFDGIEGAVEATVNSLDIVIGVSPGDGFDPDLFDGLFLIREAEKNWYVVREEGKQSYSAYTVLGVREIASYDRNAEWLQEALRQRGEAGE